MWILLDYIASNEVVNPSEKYTTMHCNIQKWSIETVPLHGLRATHPREQQ